MFHSLSGFKACYQDLTLMVVSEFDEWRVIIHSREVVLQGQRQFKETKAKEHALLLVRSYLQELKQQPADDLDSVEWRPTAPGDWLVWKS